MAQNRKAQVSDHFDGERFFFPNYPDMLKGFGDILKWSWTRNRTAWPKWIENKAAHPFAVHPPKEDWHIHFVNHATVYTRMPGLSFVTDPLWSDRSSPFTWAGPKRVRAPGFKIEAMPELDLVLVSHNHYDHLDIQSLKLIKKIYDPLFLIPCGDGPLFRKHGIQKLEEMDWHEKIEHNGHEIFYVPAQHWSARGLRDRNKSLWGGFVVRDKNAKQFYFAGDTGYGPFFKELRQRYGAMDFSLLPIGAYEPRWFMRDMHMNPQDAVMAHADLQSRLSLAIHYGSFQLTDEGINHPVEALAEALNKAGRQNEFLVLEHGGFHSLNLSASSFSASV